LQTAGNGSKDLTRPRQSGLSTNLTMRQMEARYIELVLAEEDGSIERAAKRLGISRSSLYSKVKMKEIARPLVQSDAAAD